MPTARIHVTAPDGREVTVAGRDGRVIARGRGRFDFDVVPQRIVVTAPGFRPHVIDMQPTMRWVSITQGTSLLNGPFAFESSYHHEGDAFMRMLGTTRPSGIAAPQAFPAITRDASMMSFYQRIMQGLGLSVGPRGADGLWGPNTSNATRNFQTWYNAEPAAERGPNLVVDGLLGPETQRALNRYQGRASDRVVAQVPVVVSPARPAAPPMAGSTPVPATWGRSFLDPTITLGTTTQGGTSPWVVVGTVTALVGASLAVANYLQTRRSARR